MDYTTILLERKTEERIGIITLHRPEVRNAINETMREELIKVVGEFEADPDIRAVIITGGPKVFAAGADIAAMVTKEAIEQFNRISLWDVSFKIEASRKPYIAAVSGFCLGGGCELAMACDVRIAAAGARFGQAEINIGIIPGGGGTVRLTKLVGLGKAKELVLTGTIIPADEALNIGLVNKVVPDEEFMDAAIDMAQQMSRHSPVALGLAKYAVQKAADVDLQTGRAIENSCFSLAFASEDQQEGMKAFLEKRKPEYKGR
ncbi:MAG: enoyl-CoA hydratase/isomerase family protein [Deltaproteobacteria bacterium]|nr:enoyl-CoA hydratase/isomerase family protein [Deltaproteobacteria bacterium]